MARAHRSNRLIDRAADPRQDQVEDRSTDGGSQCTADHVAPSFRVRCAAWSSGRGRMDS